MIEILQKYRPTREEPPRLYLAFASSSRPSLKKGGECVAYLTHFPTDPDPPAEGAGQVPGGVT